MIAGADGTIEWVGPADGATLPDGVDVLQSAVVTNGLDAVLEGTKAHSDGCGRPR